MGVWNEKRCKIYYTILSILYYSPPGRAKRAYIPSFFLTCSPILLFYPFFFSLLENLLSIIFYNIPSIGSLLIYILYSHTIYPILFILYYLFVIINPICLLLSRTPLLYLFFTYREISRILGNQSDIGKPVIFISFPFLSTIPSFFFYISLILLFYTSFFLFTWTYI